MKKFYSILALAALVMSGEVNAQEAYKAPKGATVETIIENIKPLTTEVDVTSVGKTVGITAIREKIEEVNPNILIVCKTTQITADEENLPNVVRIDRKGSQGMGIANKFVIDDEYPFYSKRVFDAKSGYYYREVKNEYNTMCLPFCFLYEKQREGLHFEILTDVKEDLLTFTRIDATSFDPAQTPGKHHIACGTPLVVHLHDFVEPEELEEGQVNFIEIEAGNCTINGKEDKVYPDLAYTLVGDYVERTILAKDSETGYIQDNRFWTGADFDVPVTVKPYRCILKNFKVSESKAVKFAHTSTTTAIKNVSANSTSAAYNLQGLRVAADTKGLIVVDGKKVFNK